MRVLVYSHSYGEKNHTESLEVICWLFLCPYCYCCSWHAVSAVSASVISRSRATSAGNSRRTARPITSSGVWPPPTSWPANRGAAPSEDGADATLLNNLDYKKIQRPKTVSNSYNCCTESFKLWLDRHTAVKCAELWSILLVLLLILFILNFTVWIMTLSPHYSLVIGRHAECLCVELARRVWTCWVPLCGLSKTCVDMLSAFVWS